MNLQTMEYFSVLAREKNYTRASEALHITQQSLSAHIASVEQELGCQLVVRHTPLELTYAGRVFLRYAEKIRTEVREMQHELGDIAGNQKGELRVGIAFTRGRMLMPQLITAFQREYPNVSVLLTEESNDVLQKLLSEGKIDVAIANFTKLPEGCEAEEYYDEKIVLLLHHKLAEQYKISVANAGEVVELGEIAKLKDCSFLLCAADDIAGRIGREILKRSGVEPKVRVKSDNMETLLTLCQQGAGACFVPEIIARSTLGSEEVDKMCLLRLSEAVSYPIRFGYLKRSYEWSMIREFIRIARTEKAGIL